MVNCFFPVFFLVSEYHKKYVVKDENEYADYSSPKTSGHSCQISPESAKKFEKMKVQDQPYR